MSKNNESGFTLFELMIGMMIMSILIAPFVYQKTMSFEEDMNGIAVSEINDLFQSAQNFAAEQGGSWPGEGTNCANAINVLRSANYLLAFNPRSPFNSNYVPSCTTGNGKRFIVTLNAGSNGKAELLAGYLPSSTVIGTNVRVSAPLPESIPAMTHLLPRDGSRPMTGNLNMGGKDVNNLNNLNASGNIRGALLIDNNDPNFRVDPNNRSYLNTMDINSIRDREDANYQWDGNGRSHMNAMDIRSIRDKDNTVYQWDGSGRSQMNAMDIRSIRDMDNTGYQWDGSGTSRMNYADLNYARLRNSYSEGAACTTKQIGTTTSGALMSCVSGRWQKFITNSSYVKGSVVALGANGLGIANPNCPSGTTGLDLNRCGTQPICERNWICLKN